MLKKDVNKMKDQKAAKTTQTPLSKEIKNAFGAALSFLNEHKGKIAIAFGLGAAAAGVAYFGVSNLLNRVEEFDMADLTDTSGRVINCDPKGVCETTANLVNLARDESQSLTPPGYQFG